MNYRPLKYPLRSGDQLFFMHIPKTGGTTLRAILETQFKPEEIGPFINKSLQLRLRESDPSENWSQFRFLTGHFDYNIYKALPRKPVYLTMLRHPVQRTISVYMHAIRDPNHKLYRIVAEQQVSLSDFLQLPEAKHRIYNRQTQMVAGVRWSDRKNTVSEQTLLEIARVHLDEFAFFGLTERFEESIRLLTYTFDWQPIRHYEALNVTPPSSRRAVITPDILDAIMPHIQLDIELYRFAEELLEVRLQQMQVELRNQPKLRHPVHLRPIGRRLAAIRQKFVPDGSPLGNFYVHLRRRLLGW
jgi:hypothetical protein